MHHANVSPVSNLGGFVHNLNTLAMQTKGMDARKTAGNEKRNQIRSKGGRKREAEGRINVCRRRRDYNIAWHGSLAIICNTKKDW